MFHEENPIKIQNLYRVFRKLTQEEKVEENND